MTMTKKHWAPKRNFGRHRCPKVYWTSKQILRPFACHPYMQKSLAKSKYIPKHSKHFKMFPNVAKLISQLWITCFLKTSKSGFSKTENEVACVSLIPNCSDMWLSKVLVPRDLRVCSLGYDGNKSRRKIAFICFLLVNLNFKMCWAVWGENINLYQIWGPGAI